MEKQKKEIKVEVTFKEGYQQRYTEQCIKVIEKNRRLQESKEIA